MIPGENCFHIAFWLAAAGIAHRMAMKTMTPSAALTHQGDFSSNWPKDSR
jgi:hypothetical protein